MEPNSYIEGFNKLTKFIEQLYKEGHSKEEIHQMLAEKVYNMTQTNRVFT